MALYESLPVYKLAYDILREVHEMSTNVQREHRFTLVEKLRNNLIDMMVCIYKANVDEEEKVANIKRAREHLVEIKLYMRLLHDLKQISVRRFAIYCDNMESLSKQLATWHKKSRK